jgi:hypothetical protein
MTYPATRETHIRVTATVTEIKAELQNYLMQWLENAEAWVGYSTDTSVDATLAGRIVALEEALVGTQFPIALASATHGPLSTTITDTSEHSVIASPGAGLALYVTQISLWNSSSVFTVMAAKEGAGGTTRLDAALAATPGAGFVKEYDPPWQLPEATTLTMQATVAVSSVLVNVDFYSAAPS